MPERNVVQAMFPQGSRVIPNAHGTAPGIDLERARAGRPPARFFCLPGVPAEMKEMWQETVAPAIRAALPGPAKTIRHYCIRCFGAGESHIEQLLPDLIRRGRRPSVGITAHQATITLRITAEGESEEACLKMMAPTLDTIRRSLGDLVYGEQDDELQHVVARQLAATGKTLAVAEWGTGGLLAHWLSDACGDNASFLGGLVIRSPASLGESLRVPEDVTARHGDYSRETAAAMAERCREQFGADMALAVGPFPPLAASAERPSETHFALATGEETFAESAPFTFHPDILQSRTAKQALNALRLYLANNHSRPV